MLQVLEYVQDARVKLRSSADVLGAKQRQSVLLIDKATRIVEAQRRH